ncbi:MAG: spore germination protein GerW family protein [Candidatus Wallbacteria bacterium]|nr:spore germination protein GerW family protein [Candidatus Wallbacteria bacterium]
MLDNLVKTMLAELKSTIKSETIVGAPITVGEVSIIPVTKISFGFGAGGEGSDKKNGFGGGSGGGASVEPVAFIVISKGEAKILTLKTTSEAWEKLLDPELFKKVKSTLGNLFKGEEKGEEKGGDKDDSAA